MTWPTEHFESPVIEIGPFVVSEIPGGHSHQFTDDDGEPIEFSASGWTCAWMYGLANTLDKGDQSVAEQLSGTVDTEGRAEVTWTADNFDVAGYHYGRFWVYNAATFAAATERYASPLFGFWIHSDRLPLPT